MCVSSDPYADHVEHVNDDRLKDDPLVLHVKVVVDVVPTDDHPHLVKLLQVDGVVLEDHYILEALPRRLAILRLNVQRVGAAAVHGNAKLHGVGAGVWRYVALFGKWDK